METTTTTTAEVLSGVDLRGRRRRAGLSRPALAAAARCSVTTVANMEAGYIPRRGEAMTRVLDVLSAAEAATHEAAD